MRYYRNLLRLSQAFVATQLGIGQTGYSRIESGRVEPRASQLRILANLFRCRIDDLFLPFPSAPGGGTPTSRHFISKSLLRVEDEEVVDAVDLMVSEMRHWMLASEENVKLVAMRGRKAVEWFGRFKTVSEAMDGLRPLIRRHSVVALVDVYGLAMSEFELWVGWANLGPLSGIYLKEGLPGWEEFPLVLPILGVDISQSIEAQRLAVAHLVGHHLLGHDGKVGCPSRGVSDPHEDEAAQFAIELLLPRASVEAALEEACSSLGRKSPFPDRCFRAATLLQAPFRVLADRVVSLGLVNSADREALAGADVRTLQRRYRPKRSVDLIDPAAILQAAAAMRKRPPYQADENGGPLTAFDLRSLQDCCLMGYVGSSAKAALADPARLFEQVVASILRSLPRR